MGRVRGFDTDDVVRRAREVFWRNGFEEASLPVLEAATGLRRSSIYHAFGSKRGLFDAVTQNYLTEVVRPRLRPLQEDDVHRDALVTYLVGVREALVTPRTPTAEAGCLLLNAAGGPLGADPAVRETLTAYRTELRAAVANGVAAALPDRSAAERSTTTAAVTALVVAALVLVRVDPAAAQESVAAAVDLVSRP